MTPRIYNLLTLLLLLPVSVSVANNIYSESFTIPNKGAWGANVTQPQYDLDNVSWQLSWSDCSFDNEYDYVKTVDTSGGRLEARDCNGTATWSSPWVSTTGYENISVSFITKETGSGTNAERKFLKAFLFTSPTNSIPFPSNDITLANWEEMTSNLQLDNADSLRLVVQLCNHYSNDKVIFDEVRISGKLPPVEHDNDSYCSAANLPVPKTTISSFSDHQAMAVPTLRFKITDTGKSDPFPTYVSEITLFNALNNDLTKLLEGAIIENANGEIMPSNTTITPESMVFRFNSRPLRINSGSTSTFTVKAWLTEAVTDFSELQLAINNKAHQFKTFGAGSYLAPEFPETITSAIHQVDVKGTILSVLNHIEWVEPGKPFLIAAQLTDQNGNADLNPSSRLIIEGEHMTTPISIITADSNGIFIWDKLSATQTTTLTLSSTDEEIDSVTMRIPVYDNPIFLLKENFEKPLTGWINTEDWELSQKKPLSGKQSLKHINNEKSGNSFLLHPLPVSNAGAVDLHWSVTFRNSSWDPSSKNHFGLWLFADNKDLTVANGYYMGVNRKGNDDRIKIWRMTEGAVDSIIVESEFTWKETTNAMVNVTRRNRGVWHLNIEHNGCYYNAFSGNTTSKQVSGAFCAPSFFYTSTRAGKLWIDDIQVVAVNRPPYVKKVSPIDNHTVEVLFSEPVITDSSAFWEMRVFDQSANLITHIEHSPSTPETVYLSFSNPLHYRFLLTISDIKDVDGLAMGFFSEELKLFATASPYDLIVNEIMPDPSPSQGLPAHEYIELANNSNNYFSLSDFTITVGNTGISLPDSAIAPEGYVLICNTEAAPFFSQYCTPISVGNLPVIKNLGTTITIKNHSGTVIDSITFDKSWYHDPTKDEGGWSLEKIDPFRQCDPKNNWTASCAKNGGCPGFANSVTRPNIDDQSPQVQQVIVENLSSIILKLSEEIDTALLTSDHFYIDTYEHPVVVNYYEEEPQIHLKLDRPLLPNTSYKLITKPLSDRCGNTSEKISFELYFSQPGEGDFVFNEILFDPQEGCPEFIEVLNSADYKLALSSLFIGKEGEKGEITIFGALHPSSSFVFPGEMVAVTKDATALISFFPFSCDENIRGNSNLLQFTNTGATLVLINRDSIIIDRFTYTPQMHHPLLFDTRGVSLERTSPDLPTNVANNWHSASELHDFATPGCPNSQTATSAEEVTVVVEPQAFSPDNDGYNDATIIHYTLPHSGYLANVTVFDSEGYPVTRIANNTLLSSEGTISWDGTGENSESSQPGIYLLFIQLHDTRGDVLSFKKTCVLYHPKN